jgi:hypothetical protein
MFSVPVVRARRFLRDMRGQTRAKLIRAHDGHSYVVKFCNNPSGVRVLVNELVSALLLQKLGIPTPEVVVVEFDDKALADNPEIRIETPTGTIAPQVGLHFGSRHPGSTELTVWDSLPDKMIRLISNKQDFFGALVFDKWVCTSAFRQAIFYRNKEGRQFVAEMIDNVTAFHAQAWTFCDCGSKGLCPVLAIYGSSPSLYDFEPWLDRLMRLDAEVFKSLFYAVPREWLAGQERQFSNMLMLLQDRRQRVPELVCESLAYILERRRNRVAVEQSINQPFTPEECVSA